MKKHPLNSTGFGMVEVLLVFVVLVLVTGGGAYLYHKNHKAKTVSDSTSTSSTSQISKTSTSDKSASTASPQGTYLDLTREGVKFLLSSSVSDATYAPYVSPISGATVYGLSTQKLQNSGAAGDCTAAYGPLGTISITTTAPGGSEADTDTPTTPDNKTLFLINGKYYDYQAPQDPAMCSAFTSAETQVYQQAIAQSFTSLQADN